MKALVSELRRATAGLARPWTAGVALASLLSAALGGAWLPLEPAWAQSLQPPQGRVIFTVSGRISHTNGEGGADFDRAMLQALPAATIETMTPWTDGVTKFEGPLARDLLKRVGARGSRVKALAINDYSVVIPVSDFETYPVILAMKMNDEAMHTRSKGPLWVIYPWSERPELRNEVIYGRSIWQVKEIVVEE
jgi:hypothetical protein